MSGLATPIFYNCSSPHKRVLATYD